MNEMYDWFSEGAWERFWRAWAVGSPPCHARNFTMPIEIIKNESVFSRLRGWSSQNEALETNFMPFL
jgi:hypothetical protein